MQDNDEDTDENWLDDWIKNNDIQKLHEKGVDAACDRLYSVGITYKWFEERKDRPNPSSWRELDPIGQSEFGGIVESIIRAYMKASE